MLIAKSATMPLGVKMENRDYDEVPDTSGYLETIDQPGEDQAARPTRKVFIGKLSYRFDLFDRL